MNEMVKIIISLCKQLQEANSKVSALEQEITLLKYIKFDKQKEINTDCVL